MENKNWLHDFKDLVIRFQNKFRRSSNIEQVEKFGVFNSENNPMAERYKKARNAYEIALDHFKHAEEDYIDKAITDLNEALIEWNSVRKAYGFYEIEI